MNNQNLKLVPEDSKAQEADPEFSQQLTNQKVEGTSQPENISAITSKVDAEDKKEFRRIALHTTTALSMGGVGTFFHFIGAPSEVIIIIIIIDVIYIMRFLIK